MDATTPDDAPPDAVRRRPLDRLRSALRHVGVLRPAKPFEVSVTPLTKLVWLSTYLVCLVPVAEAVFGLTLAAAPTADVKAWIDSMAPDGRADTFPLERVAEIQSRLAPASIGWLLLGAVGLFIRYRYPGPVINGLQEITMIPAYIARRCRSVVNADRIDGVAVLAFTVIAAVATALVLDQPARTDEASTYVNFVAKTPIYIATVYTRTNNHVLHNLLAWLSVSVFGDSLVAFRLPTYVAGLLLLPVTYVAARRHHGGAVAIVTIAIVGSSVWALDGSTNARGYQLITVALVGLIAMLPSLVSRRHWAWLCFVVTISLGFWIVPIMVYPATIAGVWLLLAIAIDRPKNSLQFLFRLTIAVTVIIVTVIALYSPAQVVSKAAGVASAQAAWAAHPTFLDILRAAPWRAAQLSEFWNHARPVPLQWLLLGGAVASPFVAHRTGPYGSRILWSTLLALLGVLAVTSVYPPYWSLGFLYPIWALLASVGIIGALSFVPLAPHHRRWSATALAALIVLSSLPTVLDRNAMRDTPWYIGFPDAEAVVAELEEPLRDGAHIDATFASGSAVNYYLYRLDTRLFLEERPLSLDREPERLYLLLPPDATETRVEPHLQDLLARGYVQADDRWKVGVTEIVPLHREP